MYFDIKKNKYEIFLENNWKNRYKIKDPFEDLLENIIDEITKERELSELYGRYLRNIYLEDKEEIFRNFSHINLRSKAKVIYVSPQELPSGIEWKVLGQYDPNTHTIYIANNLDPAVEKFVYYHEEAHSVGIRSEKIADDYAASRVGYNLNRGYDYALGA